MSEQQAAKVIELLEEIAITLKELKQAQGEAAVCGHGTTGFCMNCYIQHDLGRPR